MNSIRKILEGDERRQLEEQRRGYMARELVQCTLPHSNPKRRLVHKRVDGNLTLSITAHPEIGLPFGTIPRLLMLWVTSEAMRTQSKRLVLGSAEKGNNSLSAFLREVGLSPETGRGKRGDAKRLRDQMVRLFRSRISFEYSEKTATEEGCGWVDMAVAPKGYLWWDFNQPDASLLFESWIELSEEFYTAITKNAVPVNLTLAGKLKRSPLALDLFVWTTYRLYRMKEGQQITIPLADMQDQFGTEYNRPDNFRSALQEAITKIKGNEAKKVPSVWKDAPLELTERGLVLTGIPQRLLPVQPEITGFLTSRKRRDCFDLTAKELMRAETHAFGWDVRAMRIEWEKWCRGQGITDIDKPVAHFIKFLKSHVKQNGKGY